MADIAVEERATTRRLVPVWLRVPGHADLAEVADEVSGLRRGALRDVARVMAEGARTAARTLAQAADEATVIAMRDTTPTSLLRRNDAEERAGVDVYQSEDAAAARHEPRDVFVACPVCAKMFYAAANGGTLQRYCSNSCRVRASYYRRHRAVQPCDVAHHRSSCRCLTCTRTRAGIAS